MSLLNQPGYFSGRLVILKHFHPSLKFEKKAGLHTWQARVEVSLKNTNKTFKFKLKEM